MKQLTSKSANWPINYQHVQERIGRRAGWGAGKCRQRAEKGRGTSSCGGWEWIWKEAVMGSKQGSGCEVWRGAAEQRRSRGGGGEMRWWCDKSGAVKDRTGRGWRYGRGARGRRQGMKIWFGTLNLEISTSWSLEILEYWYIGKKINPWNLEMLNSCKFDVVISCHRHNLILWEIIVGIMNYYKLEFLKCWFL